MQPAQSHFQPAACGPRAGQVTAACTMCHPDYCEHPNGLQLSLCARAALHCCCHLPASVQQNHQLYCRPASSTCCVLVQVPNGVPSQLCTAASSICLQLSKSILTKVEAQLNCSKLPCCRAVLSYQLSNQQFWQQPHWGAFQHCHNSHTVCECSTDLELGCDQLCLRCCNWQCWRFIQHCASK